MRVCAVLLAVLLAGTGTGVAQDAAPAEPGSRPVAPSRFGQRIADPAYGAFQRGRYLTALNLALEAAERGETSGKVLAAEIYSRGLGVRRDLEEAARLYGEAAEAGNVESQFALAMMKISGEGTAADMEGAYVLLGQAADAGHRLAQFNYAQMLVDRFPGPPGMERASDYYERAARAGLADAQYAMAVIHGEGLAGHVRDDQQARQWMARAAAQNHDTAQMEFGTWLVEGRGGEVDYEQGFAWVRRAAASGNVAARNRLAKLYRSGLGVDADSVEAAAWYLAARRAGLTDPVMEDHLAGLTDDQIASAESRAAAIR